MTHLQLVSDRAPALVTRYAQRLECEKELAKRRANQTRITHGTLAGQLRHAAAMRRRRNGDPDFNRQVAIRAVLVARAWRQQLTTRLP